MNTAKMNLATASKIRLVLLPALATAVLVPSIHQPFLDRLWSFLVSTSAYNWSTFETLWTVFCYAAIEVPITVVFIKHPEWRFMPPKPGAKRTKPKGMRRPSRRMIEILRYMAPLMALDLIMIKKFADVPMEDIILSGGYDLVSSSPSFNGTTSPATATSSSLPPKTFLVPTLHKFSPSSPLQLVRALPASAPSSRRLVLELAGSFLVYDALFFFFHLSLHKLPSLKRWHAPHHSHDAQINPQITNQLSVFERLGLVLLANFSLNMLGSHVLTRTLFVPVFVWLLVEIHSGMDLPWGYEKVLPKGWAHGARGHWEHHRGVDGAYEPFFGWWDWGWSILERRLLLKRKEV